MFLDGLDNFTKGEVTGGWFGVQLFEKPGYPNEYPAAPISGIAASLEQATGYQWKYLSSPQGAGN
jgi:hypothetical protein